MDGLLRLSRRLLLLGCLWAAATAYAQTWGHEEWLTENGLPQNSVHAIAQTPDGYLWIATERGLARFNGTQFTIFNRENTPALTSDDLACLVVDEAGVLWVGAGDGLLRYAEGKFTWIEGMPTGGVRILKTYDRHDVYAVVGEEWVKIKDGVVVEMKYDVHPPYPVLAEGAGHLPDGTRWTWTQSDVVVLPMTQVLRVGKELPPGRLQVFFIDSSGQYWVGMDHGLYSLKTGKVAALGDASVLSIFEDREHDLWVGTDTGGLHVLRPQAFRSTLLGHAITTVTQTRDGAMWTGTRGDGLYRTLRGETRHVTTKDGLLSDVILSLATGKDGSLWVGTPDGLNHLRNGKIEATTAANGLPDEFVRSLYVDGDGSLWIGTRRGLAHLAGGRISMVEGLPSELVGALLRSRSGDLWVGTSGGVARVREGRVMAFTAKDGLLGGIVTALVEARDGTLWVGTKDGGVSRFDGDRFTGVTQAEVADLVADDRGGLWMTGSHGISRIASGRVTRYGASDGLPSEEAASLGHPTAWKAADGTLWFGTRKGLAVVDPAALREITAPVPVTVEQFTVDDAAWKGSTTVPPGHTRFAFEYAGLSFAAPSRVQYRYRLEGFDRDWVEAGGRRSAFYTNLGAKSYRFVVEAAGADGIWGEPATMGFIVKPKFYRTWWFIGLMVVLGVGIGALGYWLRVRALRSRFDAILAERNRMAREIHDTLAQGFVGVSLQLEITGNLLAQGAVEGAKEQVDQAKALVRDGLADARQSIWELRSGAAEAGLPERMRQMVDRIGGERGAANPRIELHAGGTYRAVDAEVEREVLRIAQEAVTNAVRHAAAARVTVELRYEPRALHLSVADDGAGFATDAVRSGRFGLVGMQERADRIGGVLEIESAPGRGTSVRLRVPLPA